MKIKLNMHGVNYSRNYSHWAKCMPDYFIARRKGDEVHLYPAHAGITVDHLYHTVIGGQYVQVKGPLGPNGEPAFAFGRAYYYVHDKTVVISVEEIIY